MPYADRAKQIAYWRERYRRHHPAPVFPPGFVPFAPGRRVGYVPDPKTGCWVWCRTRNPDGYGQVYVHAVRRCLLAHRVVWEQLHGPIPRHLECDHLCRNRACVNPAHLELVTRKTNARRGAMAKLTPALAAEIRALHAEGIIGYRRLAVLYGVSRSTIENLIRGRRGRWRD